MELGALICTAKAPSCERCPVLDSCAWVAAGCPEADYVPKGQAWAGTDRQLRGAMMGVLRAAQEPVPDQLLTSVGRVDMIVPEGLVPAVAKLRALTPPPEQVERCFSWPWRTASPGRLRAAGSASSWFLNSLRRTSQENRCEGDNHSGDEGEEEVASLEDPVLAGVAYPVCVCACDEQNKGQELSRGNKEHKDQHRVPGLGKEARPVVEVDLTAGGVVVGVCSL